MGQAKRRGTYEQRVAQAVDSQQMVQFFGDDKERKPEWTC